MNCPKCNTPISDKARFCPECGAALPTPAEPAAQVTVTQQVGRQEGGKATALEIGQSGPVTIVIQTGPGEKAEMGGPWPGLAARESPPGRKLNSRVTGPRVVSTIPPDGATEVSRRLKSIQITFDRPMQRAGCSISSTGWFGLGEAQVEYNPDTYTFTITRDNVADPLPANTVIPFTINPPDKGTESGFRDAAGNRAETYRFSFTTRTELESLSPKVDQPALREAMVEAFSMEELKALCADIERDLLQDGIKLKVNLELLESSGKRGKILDLIEYLDRRLYLAYLVNAVRRARRGII
jgi:hypothetical protein